MSATTLHVLTYEHADHGLSRLLAAPAEQATACLSRWIAEEEASGEQGRLSEPSAYDPEGAVQVWRGEFGSRIARFALEVLG
jgi:hypothetical protein